MYGLYTGDLSFKGYGIESVIQFFEDVSIIETGYLKPDDLEGKRPTFKDAAVSTAVIEAVNKSLEENGQWINVEFSVGEFQAVV